MRLSFIVFRSGSGEKNMNQLLAAGFTKSLVTKSHPAPFFRKIYVDFPGQDLV